jgi:hypothetical protein
MTIRPTESKQWKMRAFGLGAGLGLFMGLLAAYIYVNNSEEEMRVTGERTPVTASDLLTLSLSGLAFVRQMSEFGQTPKTKGRKK